jgi:hypothetical protein
MSKIKPKKKKYVFFIGVVDTYLHNTCVDVKNLSGEEAKIVLRELILKFGGD